LVSIEERSSQSSSSKTESDDSVSNPPSDKSSDTTPVASPVATDKDSSPDEVEKIEIPILTPILVHASLPMAEVEAVDKIDEKPVIVEKERYSVLPIPPYNPAQPEATTKYKSHISPKSPIRSPEIGSFGGNNEKIALEIKER